MALQTGVKIDIAPEVPLTSDGQSEQNRSLSQKRLVREEPRCPLNQSQTFLGLG